MSTSSETAIHTVTISYSDLKVPGYSLLHQNLLQLSTRYNFGWSHGKEKLESGKPDMLKGSFYANPMLDIPTAEKSLIHRDEMLNFPEVVHIHQELIPSGGSLTFGEYTEKLLDKYYHLKSLNSSCALH